LELWKYTYCHGTKDLHKNLWEERIGWKSQQNSLRLVLPTAPAVRVNEDWIPSSVKHLNRETVIPIFHVKMPILAVPGFD
jgi:hypothetical protein